jgi:GNAT superfamily N-acetyltransferase
MDVHALALAGDDNLAATWAAFGRAVGADVVEHGPLTLVATGLPIPFFNGAYVHGPVQDPAALVDEAVRFFAARSLPWLLRVRDGLPPALVEAGEAAGLRPAGGPPAMGLFAITDIPPPPAGLTTEVVTTTAGLADHATMLSEGFAMPAMVAERLFQPGLLALGDLAVLVGRVDGEPVSCSAMSITGTTVGVYNVATPERFRGKGYGEALTWAAIAEGARRGCSTAILQASDAGYPIYVRMGFVELGRYLQLEGPAA